MQLNPRLDVNALAHDYAPRRRIQIRDVFLPADAVRIRTALTQTPWSITYNEGKTVHRLSPDEQQRLSPQHVNSIMAGIRQRAARQFQFLYEYDPIFVRYFALNHPWMAIFEAYEFLNSAPMLDFLRLVTGIPSIRWVDAQATSYAAGNFLKMHDDINQQEQRLAAYVLNLTPDWPADWGGYLQFLDEHGDVEHGYRPLMNALNLFTVPSPHSVEMVSMFAPERRLSITGWLRADKPPGIFGRYRESRI